MRTRIGLTVVLSLGALLVAGCLYPTVLTEEDDGRLVTLDVRGLLVVRLEGNPSTGYEWELASQLDPWVLQEIGEPEFESGDDDDIVGTPGTYVFRFRAVGSGTVPLQFVYKRPWEEEPLDTFSVVVYVR